MTHAVTFQIMVDLAQKCEETVMYCGKKARFDLRLRDYACCSTSRPSRESISSFNLDLAKLFGSRTVADAEGKKGVVKYGFRYSIWHTRFLPDLDVSETISSGNQRFLWVSRMMGKASFRYKY